MIMQAEAPKQEQRWEIVGQMAKERYRAEEIAEQVGIARSLVYKDKKRYEEETGETLPKPVQKSRFRDPYAEQWEAEQVAKQETQAPSDDYEQRFAKLLKKYEAICEDYEQLENKIEELEDLQEVKTPNDIERQKDREEMKLAQKHAEQLEHELKAAEQQNKEYQTQIEELQAAQVQPSNKVQELEAQLEDYRRTRAVWKEDYERVRAENQNLQAQLQECREQEPGEDYKAKYEAVVQALKAHL